jgi:hypothetical protein
MALEAWNLGILSPGALDVFEFVRKIAKGNARILICIHRRSFSTVWIRFKMIPTHCGRGRYSGACPWSLLPGEDAEVVYAEGDR